MNRPDHLANYFMTLQFAGGQPAIKSGILFSKGIEPIF